MVDALNCAQGCIYGTGVEEEKTKTDDILYELQAIKETSKTRKRSSAWDKNSTPAQRLKNLNKQFAQLNLDDFIREYTDKSKENKIQRPSMLELDDIFQNMNKTGKMQRKINCIACGYNTCTDMATAIYNGCNNKESCVHYIKNLVEDEKNRIQEISASTTIIDQVTAELRNKFETIQSL